MRHGGGPMDAGDRQGVELILLASPRGWCAGVDRAVAMAKQELSGSRPVYLRHPIVHNEAVTADLAGRGAHIVEDTDAVLPGSTMVISAHGSPPSVISDAMRRGLSVVDATCPLVQKVHAEARRFAAAGYTVLLIGHRGHVEVIGTIGQAPDSVVLVETVADVRSVDVADPQRVAWLCQTTLSVTDAADIAAEIRRRFPQAVAPRHDDICYATTNRQTAVVAVAERSDVVLVIGSVTSSNSRRLVERARETGCRAELISGCSDLAPEIVVGCRVVGLTSGASTPEHLVDEVLDWFRVRFDARVEELSVVDEDVHFAVPRPAYQDAERAIRPGRRPRTR